MVKVKIIDVLIVPQSKRLLWRNFSPTTIAICLNRTAGTIDNSVRGWANNAFILTNAHGLIVTSSCNVASSVSVSTQALELTLKIAITID